MRCPPSIPFLIAAVLSAGGAWAQEAAPAPGADDDARAKGLATLTGVLQSLDDPASQRNLLKGMLDGLKGRRGVRMPDGWKALSGKLGSSPDAEVRFQALALSAVFGDAEAVAALRGRVQDAAGDPAVRQRALHVLLGLRDPGLPPLLRALLAEPALRGAALRGLAVLDDPKTPARILEMYPSLNEDERRDALGTLASRVSFARALVEALRSGPVPKRDVSEVLLRQLRGLKDPDIDREIAAIRAAILETHEGKEREIARLRKVIEGKHAASADASRGRAIFARTCQVCHTLFGTGGQIGPELTGANRADLAYLLTNAVDPNALIGKGYEMATIVTKDERVIAGIVRKQDDVSVTVVTPGETTVIPREDIESLTPSDVSMMPEGQLSAMPDADVRDLVAYLQAPSQVPMLATPDNVASFFNGRDISNWDGLEGLWKVENGEIVGKTEKGLKRNDFLKSRMAVEDFRLVVQVKLVPNEANSGIQFRTEALENGEVKGYQADVGAGWWGKLYEENGRALLWKQPGDQHVKPNDWNLYEVLAVGHKIRTAINGHLCVDFEDPSGATRGIIAFQVHSGGPTEVRFKDLKLELNPKFELKTVK